MATETEWTRDKVRTRVIEILAQLSGRDKATLGDDTTWNDGLGSLTMAVGGDGDGVLNSLGFDSLDTVEAVMELEDEFEISIPDETAAKLNTVSQTVDHVWRVLENAA